MCRASVRAVAASGGPASLGATAANNPNELDLIVPITYSVHLEQLHHELRRYKDTEYAAAARSRFRVGLTAVLWRFLAAHEACVAAAVGVDAFDAVTTVPSTRRVRDDRAGGLRTIVADMCGHTRGRYVRALVPSDRGSTDRAFDADRYEIAHPVDAPVLLIDDTWTSGSHAQSAAHTLREAGVSTVAIVVIGRHVHRDFENTDEVLRAQPRPFDWNTCAVHGQ